MRFFYSIFFFVLCGSLSAKAQFTADEEKYLDSLAFVAEHEKEDSIVLNALLTWDDFIYAYDRDLDFELNRRIVAIVQQGLNKPGINDRYRQIYLRSYSVAQNNLGLLLMDDEEFLSALKCFQVSLQIAEHYQDSMKIGNALNNIGMIYEHLRLNEKAIEYYTESHSYDKADLISTGSYYNNVALCYMAMGDTVKAFELLTLSLAYSDSADDFRGMGNTHSNLGIIYLGWNQPEEALRQYELSIAAYDRGESGGRSAMSYKGMGLAYLDLGNYSKAIEYCQKAYEIATQSESILAQKESCYCLYEANKKIGNTASALQYHEDYVTHRNALEDAEKRVELLKTDFQFNLDRQHLQDSLTYSSAQQLERERFETKLEKKQITQYVLFGGILFCLVLGAFILRSYFRKKKDAEIISNQKREVELQKHIVEEKNKEITDSINYAKRIQDAILPSTILLENTFKDCFVYYKPKDIIAGDFYWLEKK
ncbi:MAG: tetratricopeptide repeat protein [Crocinitomicaceae bacterium]|nr:tetratricopeptide repeat protein [Crocinitomicaceae bacterium]